MMLPVLKKQRADRVSGNRRRLPVRILSLLLLLAVCLTIFPGPSPAYAADYIAAEHTKSNGCPYYIMVNRSCNTVTIYTLDSSGYYTVPYKAMICSTGRSGHRTPTGTFAITSTKKRWCYMVDGSYGQYSSQFSGNYLFHSVCYSKNNCASLLTYEYNALGDYASLGCVRLQVEDAKWIYDNCKAGTKVTIYDGTVSGALGKPAKAVANISSDLDCGWEPTDPASGNPWKVTVNVQSSSWSTGAGTVSGGGTYIKTTSVTLKAQPDEDSEFTGWYNADGYLVSEENPWTFSASGSVLYQALFDELPPDGTWEKQADGKWYYTVDEVLQTGWIRYQKQKYYLDPDTGAMKTGWQAIGGKWYYFSSSGAMVTDWKKLDGKWYYLNTDGTMVTGWKQIDGKWYYFNGYGDLAFGWKKYRGQWYYFGSDGAMVTGWKKIDGLWYYLNPDGAMVTGWQKYSGSWYWLGSDGAMVTDTSIVYNGVTYYFNADGVCTNP